MKRTFLVEQALDLFYQLDDVVYSSSSESESGDDEIDDSAFVVHNERDDEQPGPSTTPTTSRQRPTQRGGGRKSQTRSRSPAKSGQPLHSSEPWKTESDPVHASQNTRSPGEYAFSTLTNGPVPAVLCHGYHEDTLQKHQQAGSKKTGNGE
ncbi:unnamed protein product [Leuciscus chuanchicus]